ncbi:MAG: 50S ribosomal protein L29 [Microgenomates group bacterium]
MSKYMKEVSQKTAEELKKDIATARLELAKLNVEMTVSPQKNSNVISNKKKQLAVLLTALQQKK